MTIHFGVGRADESQQRAGEFVTEWAHVGRLATRWRVRLGGEECRPLEILFDFAQQFDREYGIDLQDHCEQWSVARSLKHVGYEPRALRHDEEVRRAANAGLIIELDPFLTLRNDYRAKVM